MSEPFNGTSYTINPTSWNNGWKRSVERFLYLRDKEKVNIERIEQFQRDSFHVSSIMFESGEVVTIPTYILFNSIGKSL